MKILSTQVLNGPNYWSNYRKKLIVLKLDIGKYEELPTNLLPGFEEELKLLLPSLYAHRCSIGTEGGLFQRIHEGTWLGHVVEHVALELQTLAGMNCGFGRTFGSDEKGIYHVLFAYEVEKAGLYAGKVAVEIIKYLAEKKSYLTLANDIKELKRMFDVEKLGPSTQSIVDEAKKRGIPCSHIKETSLILLGQGVHQKKVWASVSSQTNAISVDLAADKKLTKKILAESFIPVPEGIVVQNLDELEAGVREFKFPLVIKPRYGNHGRGITTNIDNIEKAIFGFNFAKTISNDLILEQFIQGNDYRFLLIDFKVIAVAQRSAPMIIGTGAHTIQQLIDILNYDPKRGHGHENVLTEIEIDDATLAILDKNNFNLNSILPQDKKLVLKESANISTGGTAEDVTEIVHPDNLKLAERVARLINLDVCGIDIISQDIRVPLQQNNGVVIEVNAGPGFRMHLSPTKGLPRNVAEPFMDMLYPSGCLSKIPIVAITGTNGKTTVGRLIAHLAQQEKYVVGLTTTEGIYLNGALIYRGDCSGSQSAQVILRDPSVEFAVLECARGGIIRTGLGFDECSISVITNISSDHLGLMDINSLDELTRVKAVVARSTVADGYAILNADDDLVYSIKEDLICNIALFGEKKSIRIQEHCEAGGLAAYIEQDDIVIHQGEHKSYFMKLVDIPITFSGTASCMIQNTLPAILAGFISHFSLEEMKKALSNFHPTVKQIPGRMNLFNFDSFQVMMDYAHNENAFIELQKYLNTIECQKKIGIIGAPGDRRAEDIQKMGFYSAQLFDEIIIRHDVENRGRSNEELTDLLMHGIKRSELDPNVTIISDGIEALEHAMQTAKKDSFIFYTCEQVFTELEFMQKQEQIYKQKNRNISH